MQSGSEAQMPSTLCLQGSELNKHLFFIKYLALGNLSCMCILGTRVAVSPKGPSPEELRHLSHVALQCKILGGTVEEFQLLQGRLGKSVGIRSQGVLASRKEELSGNSL